MEKCWLHENRGPANKENTVSDVFRGHSFYCRIKSNSILSRALILDCLLKRLRAGALELRPSVHNKVNELNLFLYLRRKFQGTMARFLTTVAKTIEHFKKYILLVDRTRSH